MLGPRVEGLCGFGLEVPDLAVAERFYSAFGMQAHRQSGARNDPSEALGMRSLGRAHDECLLRVGSHKRLHHVSFFAAADNLAKFAERIERRGLTAKVHPPDGWSRPGLWFEDPWGTWINLSPIEPTKRAVQPIADSNLYGATRRKDIAFWQQLEVASVAPVRLGHMLIFSDEWENAEDFYREVLGLRPSDRAEGKVVFMAAAGDLVDHHCFGVINGTHRGFQHASFEMASFDEIGMATLRMRESGYSDAFGPGRHMLGSNLFQYFRDPWGSWIEYYSDMDKITPDWKCVSTNKLPYIWGPEWSPEFWGGEMNANLEPKP